MKGSSPYMQYSTDEKTEQDGIFHPKPFQVQGLCLGHKQVEPKVVSPQRQSALVGACVCQPKRGETSGKLPVPHSLTHTHAHIHTHAWPAPAVRLTCSHISISLIAYVTACVFNGWGCGGHGCVVMTSHPQTTQQMTLDDVCSRLCTFPRKYLWHVLWLTRWASHIQHLCVCVHPLCIQYFNKNDCMHVPFSLRQMLT